MVHSQSALLKYWSFEPTLETEDSENKPASASKPDNSASGESLKTARTVKFEDKPATEAVISSQESPAPAPRTGATDTVQSEEKEQVPPKKLIPVIFFDEAHRLPLLIKDKKAMKCILDAMLVLTKQVKELDRRTRNDPLTRLTGPSDTCDPRYFRPFLQRLAPTAQHHATLQDHVDRRCNKRGSPSLLSGEPASRSAREPKIRLAL